MEIAANKIAPAQVPTKTHSGHSSPRLQIDRVTLTSNRPAGVGDAYRAPQGTERIKPRHSAKQHRCQGTYPPPKGATDIPGLEVSGTVDEAGAIYTAYVSFLTCPLRVIM